MRIIVAESKTNNARTLAFANASEMTLESKARILYHADFQANGGECFNAPYKLYHDGDVYIVKVIKSRDVENRNQSSLDVLEIHRPAKIMCVTNI